jgi:peptide/nickel transport system substrate-binding protein
MPFALAEDPKYGGVLRDISDAPPPGNIGWPPRMFGAGTESPQLMFDGLVRSTNKGDYYPWLAESFKVADDYSSIIFHLRKNVKFHDGSLLTAEVAKWNLDKWITAKRQPDWKSVDILDEYTIRLNVKEWKNTIMYTLIGGTWMVSKAAYDKHGEDWMKANPVGCGPYKFVSFGKDTKLKTEKFADYWQKGKPYLDGYEKIYVKDQTTRKAVMQAGEGDIISVEPGKQAYDMKELDLDINVDIVSIFGLAPDTANPNSVWANKKFRQAVAYAIDREAIADSLGYGYWKAPYQLPPRANLAHDPDFAGRRYNPEKARQLLTEAGYPDGVTTKIIVTPLSLNKDACLAIQNNLAEVGIVVEMEYPQWSKYVTHLRGTWKNAALLQVFPAIGGANYNATLNFYFSPKGILLKSWLRTPKFLELFEKSLKKPEMDIDLIRAVCREIYEDASIIPLYESGKGWAIRPYVKNGNWLKRSMTMLTNHEQIWLDK